MAAHDDAMAILTAHYYGTLDIDGDEWRSVVDLDTLIAEAVSTGTAAEIINEFANIATALLKQVARSTTPPVTAVAILRGLSVAMAGSDVDDDL